MSSSNINECGLSKVLIFLLTVLLRACTSICSKVIMSMSGSVEKGKILLFHKPLFTSCSMFVGISFAMVMHVFVVFFRIPFPGYDHHLSRATTIEDSSESLSESSSDEIMNQVQNVHSATDNGLNKNQSFTTVEEDLLERNDWYSNIMLQSGLLTKEASDMTEPTLLEDSYSSRGLESPICGECSEDDYCPPLMKQQISLADHQIINTTYHPPNDLSNDTGDTSISTDESGSLPTDTTSPISLKDADESKIMRRHPLSMYFILAIPALLDLGATAFSIAGLVYLDVSIFQMISNSNIVFVALMKHYVLKNLLCKFHWVGVFWIVVSVFIGGSSVLLESRMSGNVADGSATDSLVGVILVMAGAALYAVQTVMEEKLMNADVPVPPLLLIGMQGLWGVVLSIFVMFPVGYALPGNDQGSYENPFDSWSLLMKSSNLQLAYFVFIVGTFAYNVAAILVVLQLGSIWYSISTNFAVVISWLIDLFIFYYINPMFGEDWTKVSYIQIAGLAVLLYGTAIYNGSLLLKGQLLWAFGVDCSNEYIAIKREQEQTYIEIEDTLEEPLLANRNEGIV